jgi:hypothetical protein
VYAGLVALLVVVPVLVPRRFLPALVLALPMLLAAGSAEASRYLAQRAEDATQGFPGGTIAWVDAATSEPVAYLYDGEPWDAVWQQVFWNRHIVRVFDLGPAGVPGPAPQERLHVLSDGRLVDSRGRTPAASEVVAPTPLTVAGETLASIPESQVAQSGLTLWRVEPPLRLSSTKSGVLPNGDIPSLARFDVYACDGGTFLLTLLGKQDARVRIALAGRTVRDFHLSPDEIWRGRIPTPASPGRVCRYTIAVTGYTGSTLFSFERGT